MASTATEDVQIAVVGRVENDTTLINTHGVTGVFDEAPDDQPYPYISVGTKVETPWISRTFGKREKEVTLVLDIWTDIHDNDIHFAILDDVNRLFDNPVDGSNNPWPLPLTSYTNTQCVVEWSTTLIDESMDARHTVARLFTVNT
jgi:hypothetical protein